MIKMEEKQIQIEAKARVQEDLMPVKDLDFPKVLRLLKKVQVQNDKHFCNFTINASHHILFNIYYVSP